MLLQNLGDKQNLLEIKMAPRETKNNASAKFGWQTKSIVVCYGILNSSLHPLTIRTPQSPSLVHRCCDSTIQQWKWEDVLISSRRVALRNGCGHEHKHYATWTK